MRKFFLSFIALSILLSGCELSILDELPTEEEMGFDEPVTVENEYGSITYQFNDSVLYVTERVQEHITMINDSTLFYDGDTPKEWRPYEGCKLAASVSHLIPMGLNNRVTSVTKQDGGYLVRSVRTTVEDVYKELNYNIDFEKDVPYVDPDATDEELAEMGMERLADSTIMCWDDYDRMRTKALRLEDTETRATEVSDTVRDDEHISIAFFVSPGGVKWLKGAKHAPSIKKYIDKLINICNRAEALAKSKGSALDNFSVGLNLAWTTHAKTHAERNEKTKYEKQITDQYSTFTFGAELKYTQGLDAGNIDPKTIGGHRKHTNTEKALAEDLKETLKEAKSDKINMPSFKVRFGYFMLGPVPMNFILSAETNLTLNLSAVMGVKGSFKSDTSRTGYVSSNGEKQDIDEVIEEGGFSFDSFYVQGGVKCAVGGRLAFGMEVASSVGADIGLNLELGLETTLGCTYAHNSEDVLAWKVDGKFRLYCDFFADIQFYVAPLGIDVLNETVFVGWKKTLFEFATNFNPKIEYMTSYASPNFDESIDVNAMMAMKSTGMLGYFYSASYYPEMRLYFGDYSSESDQYVVMSPADSKYQFLYDDLPKAEPEKKYYYKWTGSLPKGVVYGTLVPCVKGMGQVFVFPEYKQTVETAEPDISLIESGTKQTYGGENFDFTGEVESYVDQNAESSGYGASVDPSTLRQYKFATQAAVRNGSYLRSWSIKVEIFASDGKRCVRKKVPMNPNKTGIYTLVCNFYTNWKKEVSGDPVPMHFRVTPYWVDSSGKEYTGEASKKIPIEYECADITPETTLGYTIQRDL